MAEDLYHQLAIELFSAGEAARQLGISPATLRQQIAAGRLQAVKLGRQWIVAGVEIERYRRESLGQPGAPRKAARVG